MNDCRQSAIGAAAQVVAIIVVVLLVPSAVRGDTTNIFSPVVTFQYSEGIVASPTVSFSYSEGMSFTPVVSYQYSDGIAFSAVVSYQYSEWPDNNVLVLLHSLPVSYYYQFVVDSVGDGIPDLWRARYFGGYGTTTNSLSCATGDATGTGQNNLFKYVAGLDPTNAASRFVLRVENVTGQPNQKNLIFSPRWNDRSYTPLFSTNLSIASWSLLMTTDIIDNATQRTVTDTNATEKAKFYRIQITYP